MTGRRFVPACVLKTNSARRTSPPPDEAHARSMLVVNLVTPTILFCKLSTCERRPVRGFGFDVLYREQIVHEAQRFGLQGFGQSLRFFGYLFNRAHETSLALLPRPVNRKPNGLR